MEQDYKNIKALIEANKMKEAFTELVEPLHELLFEKQTFDILETLKVEDRTLLAFDYIKTQVDVGGFIQLIQNGYVSLILTVIEGLQEMNIASEMSGILDDVLKVYVLNVELLSKETSVDEFARLYNEFTEFNILEENFEKNKLETMEKLIANKLI